MYRTVQKKLESLGVMLKNILYLSIHNKSRAMTEIADKLDARGLNCPLPILRTRKAIKDLSIGQIMEVIPTDSGSVKDVAFLRTDRQSAGV